MDFKKDAEFLSEWAARARRNGGRLDLVDIDKLLRPLDRAAGVLYRLAKLKRDLDASDPENEEQCEHMAAELVALLDLRRS